MKNLFIIISDLHIRENQNFDKVIFNAFGNALSTLKEIDHVCVLMAGDLAFSGQPNEYKRARTFLGLFSNEIKKIFNKQFIKYYIIPGNHDAFLNGEERHRINLLKLRKNINTEIINNELNYFNNFYELAKLNACFKNNKIIEKTWFNNEDIRTQINLINTELFSTCKDENDDKDKGIHYIPEDELAKINKEKTSNYSITLMHRSPEWFTEDETHILKKHISNNTNILICGHEHNPEISNKVKQENNTVEIYTGRFDFKYNDYNFNTVIIETNNDVCLVSHFKWNNNDKIFLRQSNEEYQLTKKIGSYNYLYPKQDFLKSLKLQGGKDFTKIFVYPNLEYKEIVDNKKANNLKSIEGLIDSLISNKVTFIEGSSQSGTTCLLKKIYFSVYEEYTTLYLDSDYLNGRKIDNVLKDAIAEQYGNDEIKFQQFLQTDKNKKIILIDDVDKIKPKYLNPILKKLLEEHGHIVCSCKTKQDENIISSAREKLEQGEKFTHIKIGDFYSSKRKELIKKIIEANDRIIGEQITEKEIVAIDNDIANQLNVFNLNPSFIRMYVDYYLESRERTSAGGQIFGEVFEMNLLNSISEHAGSDKLREYNFILQMLSHKIHFEQKDPFLLDDVSEVIKKYNDNYGYQISVLNFIKDMKLSNIFDDLGEDKYRFTNNNYLAYFVAKEINRLYTNQEINDDLDNICQYVGFNINGEILLFLSYITKNQKILYKLLENLSEITKDWNEYNIDKANINLFENNNLFFETQEPNEKDKEEFEKIMDEQEKAIVERNKIEIATLYDDYNEEALKTKNYKISQAIKHLELVSKILPNFNHELKTDKKQEFVKEIYQAPNKIIFEVLKDIDDNFDKYTNQLLEDGKKIKPDLKEDDVKKEIQERCLLFVLNIMDMTARFSSTKKTIHVLDKFDLSNTNYKILNIMMNENISLFNEFTSKAEKLYDKTKKTYVKLMLSLIVRKHFLCNKHLKQINNVQRVADKFFGKNRKCLK